MKQITNKYVITTGTTIPKEYITRGWSERLQEGLSELLSCELRSQTYEELVGCASQTEEAANVKSWV